MPNTFDPMVRICAHCEETRERFFGKTRRDVEAEASPIEGLAPVYLCKECKAAFDEQPEPIRQRMLYLMAKRDEHDSAPSLSGPYNRDIFARRYTQALGRKA